MYLGVLYDLRKCLRNIALCSQETQTARILATTNDTTVDEGKSLLFSIGTVAAYSAKYSALLAHEILELFQY